MKLEGVIFDLDGTLIDSEGHWFESDRKFVESFGGVYDDAFRAECVGMGSRAFCKVIQSKYGVKQDLQEMLDRKDELYLQQALGKTPVFAEMLKLVQGFAVEKMPMAVASGSTLKVIQAILADTGLAPYFAHVYSSDQVAHGKPEPDVFLFTAKQLNVRSTHCLVFEDSQHGVTAARAAKMKVVAVPSVWTEKSKPALEKADLLFKKGMSEFKAETVLDWIDRHYCQCDDCTLYEYGRCHD